MSPSTPLEAAPPRRRILVWDAPVRVFHWLLVVCFAGAWLSAEAEGWLALHATLGYTVGTLVAFRLVWGLVGTRHARFAAFVRGPRAVMRTLAQLARGDAQPHAGHNPAGGWAIVAMLGLAVLSTASGWALLQISGADWLEDLHEGLSQAWLVLVIVHVAAVIVSGRLHHENPIGAMVSGRRPGLPSDAIARAWRPLAGLMIAAVLGFWTWQWLAPPDLGFMLAHEAQRANERGADDAEDDD